ncbi:phosphoglycerate dehydrogenase [Halobellus salinus]|uniref:Phosphoglycerate dehydrogenase n=1 Tax=Halobellus salinus TaxID=931585 RepID=A0A830EID5_9EURY|nr:D-2-hydroxyacid dehydrogenase [Halobellus salinus]GGI94157.1 phosphoglycerate dehydrogenase [Halobellus salinus]SMP19569.1 D-2-hydroxyacid dehydrogenase (NADP+) [Halobellus salinus]
MRLDTLGVDESVSILFPPEILVEELAGLPVTTTVVNGSHGLDDCQAVVTFDYWDACDDLGWVHSIQSGVDQFPFDRMRAADVALTNSTGIHGDAIGETVAGYALAFSRRLHEHVANQGEATWSPPEWDDAWTVRGERACVVGLGTLGRGVVDRLTGLGVEITGVRRTPTPEPGVDEVYTPSELRDAVSNARFVVAAVPLTDDTRGLLDADVLAAMREDAYLINVARGAVVDQPALVSALEDGEIAGAALDVFETEPLPDSSPLWGMDEVIVSPHCAGFTHRYHKHVGSIVAENVERLQVGNDLINRVV